MNDRIVNQAERVFTMLEVKTVILWGRDDVLSRSIELLLSAYPGWQVVTLRDSQLQEQLLEAIDRINPKVVIIHEGDVSGSSEDKIHLPVRLMQKYPGVRVITISLGTNIMEVFNKENVCITELSDLLAAVEG